jgi:hypothetical protein
MNNYEMKAVTSTYKYTFLRIFGVPAKVINAGAQAGPSSTSPTGSPSDSGTSRS